MSHKKVIDEEEFVRLLCSGMKIKDIAVFFNISRKNLNKRYKEFGIKPKSKKFNHDFFEVIDTEEKAYWLGYIMADGCVTLTQSKRIELDSKDIEHLKKWHSAIRSNNKIHISYGKYGSSTHCSNKMVNDLEKYGVIPKKSLMLKFPSEIPESLLRHLIRGYFDGDGCISFSKRKGERQREKPQLYVGFVGTQNMLEGIKMVLGVDNSVRPRGNVFVLEFGGNKIGKRVLDFMYKDSNVHLARKFDIYKSLCV